MYQSLRGFLQDPLNVFLMVNVVQKYCTCLCTRWTMAYMTKNTDLGEAHTIQQILSTQVPSDVMDLNNQSEEVDYKSL